MINCIRGECLEVMACSEGLGAPTIMETFTVCLACGLGVMMAAGAIFVWAVFAWPIVDWYIVRPAFDWFFARRRRGKRGWK